MNSPVSEIRPGRSCPLHYRYSPSVFDRRADIQAETLYVIGGLYGNRAALDAVQEMAADEHGPVALIFNGDFNWFNVDPAGFEAINKAVLAYTALRGNVETELASNNSAAGCGCAYPDSVLDEDVERSNQILNRLRETALGYPTLIDKLTKLPMHLVAKVGYLSVGIVHGDAESLAGWQFDAKELDDPVNELHLQEILRLANIDLFASSHTCLPVLRQIDVGNRQHWVINNGAAGMPNFENSRFGLLTRISVGPCKPGRSLYGFHAKGNFVDALPIRYDQSRWHQEFLANWAGGSPAHTSYYRRIISGPAWETVQANRSVGLL